VRNIDRRSLAKPAALVIECPKRRDTVMHSVFFFWSFFPKPLAEEG
jgi:hypothetical protein